MNQLHWCNELTSAYLGTSCDTSITDGYVAAVSTVQTQSGTCLGSLEWSRWWFPKIVGPPPQIIHFNRVWNHHKPSILGENLKTPYFWNHPYLGGGFKYVLISPGSMVK